MNLDSYRLICESAGFYTPLLSRIFEELLTVPFFILHGGAIKIKTNDLSINGRIKAAQVRVINDDGSQLGVMKTRDALDLAAQQGLDLVEIAPTAEVPVCRIMDYGKYKFDKAKREKESKKKQSTVELKEVQLSVHLAAHDFNTKLNHARRFINDGNKVKICLEFQRGREMAHMELGYKTLERFELACADFCIVEKKPIREGRRITMYVAPKKIKEEKPPAKENPPEPTETENEN